MRTKKQSNTIGRVSMRKVAADIDSAVSKQKAWAKSLDCEIQLCTLLELKSDLGYDKRWSTKKKIEFVLLLYQELPMSKSHILNVVKKFERGSAPQNYDMAFYSMILNNKLLELNITKGNNIVVVLPYSKWK